ncbi:hypothetical protein NA56DRAFT_707446 [Hyaloscypha hepaticicola]|uniref:Uncharacterized protein n=1 Tax=Hyaloscypha hepaticicola TaxID=2082293 RepID=A0A2J6PUP4_9HELO|nr:hypothetical protein NA56DRAFT_707446 [Hyaloscypha hepaticicola]
MSAMASGGWKGEKYLKYGMKAEQSSARPGIAVTQKHPPESITSCTVKEDYDPARVEFSFDADFASMLSVKKDQHAFAIGNPIPGTIPKILISKGTRLRPVQMYKKSWYIENAGQSNTRQLSLQEPVPEKYYRSIVIYIWKFKGILNRGNGDNGLYAGKSITLGNRYNQYMTCLQSGSKEEGNLTNYEIGRTAAEK